jgi:cation:H+ antiporter
MPIIEIAGGLIALLGGGELLERSASHIARRYGMSPLVVGVLIDGIGTSGPELDTSNQEALRGAPGIASGNIVGSNIANILLILGVAGVLRPFACSRAAVLRDGSLVIVTAALFVAAGWTGMIERWMGAGFVVGLACYICWTFVSDRREVAIAADGAFAATGERPTVPHRPLLLDAVTLAVGLVLVIIGAEFLVDGAVEVARLADVPEETIGLSLVAVGTSLPELATTVIAAIRKHSALALGNVLGSNIYNILGIGGITALVAPIPISQQLQHFDLPVMLAVSVGLVIVTATGQRVTRREGLLLVGLYGVYLGLVIAL